MCLFKFPPCEVYWCNYASWQCRKICLWSQLDTFCFGVLAMSSLLLDRFSLWLLYYCITILWFGNSRSIRHPASGYVQGINDLVTPFLVVFLSEHLEGNIDTWSTDDLSPQDISNIEADCYWCLSKFLDVMQDHYTFAQPGIQRLVFRLKELVRRIDGNVLLILMHCQFWFWFLPIFSPLINCQM